MRIILSILKCMIYITWSEKLDYTSAKGCSDTPSPLPTTLGAGLLNGAVRYILLLVSTWITECSYWLPTLYYFQRLAKRSLHEAYLEARRYYSSNESSDCDDSHSCHVQQITITKKLYVMLRGVDLSRTFGGGALIERIRDYTTIALYKSTFY